MRIPPDERFDNHPRVEHCRTRGSGALKPRECSTRSGASRRELGSVQKSVTGREASGGLS